MDEKDLAAELQETKDDASEWEFPDAEIPQEVPPVATRRLAAMVSVRLSPDELELLQDRASARGETVSSHIRKLIMDDLSDSGQELWARFIDASIDTGFGWTATSSVVHGSWQLPNRFEALYELRANAK